MLKCVYQETYKAALKQNWKFQL